MPKKERFLSTYLLSTQIHTYWSYKDKKFYQELKKQQQQDISSSLMFIFMHKIIVKIDE